MANIGTGNVGQTIIGTGSGVSPTFANIGTNSGLTNRGLIIGQGNGAFIATSGLTDGQIVIGSSSGNPAAASLTQGSGVTITPGSNSITISLAGGGIASQKFIMQTGTSPVVPDASGNVTISGAIVAAGTNPIRTDGTGANAFTIEVQKSQAIAATDATKIGLAAFDSASFTVDSSGFVQLVGGGEAIDSIAVQTGTSPIVPTAAGLITINGATVAAGTNPVRTDGTGANTLAVEVQKSQAIAAADTTKIGLSNFDSHNFQVDSTGYVQLATMTNGQLIIGNTGNQPSIATITGSGISVSNGAGTIQLTATGGGLVWNNVTGTSQTVFSSQGYIANNAGLVTFTMNAVNQGDVARIVGFGAGGWTLLPKVGVGQIFHIGNSASTVTTGSLSSTNAGDCVELVALNSTTIIVISSIGNITVV